MHRTRPPPCRPLCCAASAWATRWAPCCTPSSPAATPSPRRATLSCRTTTVPPLVGAGTCPGMPGWGPGWASPLRHPPAAANLRKSGVHCSLPQRPAHPPNPIFPDSIPLLSPLIAPNIRALGPILSQLATSPLRSGVEQWIDLLKGAPGGRAKGGRPAWRPPAPTPTRAPQRDCPLLLAPGGWSLTPALLPPPIPPPTPSKQAPAPRLCARWCRCWSS